MFANLISICYMGGACGNAIAYIIGLSPEAWQSWPEATDDHLRLNDRGAVHGMPARLHRRLTDGSTTLHDIMSALEMHGLLFEPNKPLPEQVVAYFHAHVDEIYAFYPRTNIRTIADGMITVTAAHAVAAHQRQIYPGTKTIAVHGDVNLMLRNLANKFIFAPDAYMPGMTYIDATAMRETGRPASVRFSKSWMRNFMINAETVNSIHRMDHDSFRLDFQTLIEPKTSRDIYHSMMEYLDLTANWTDAEAFLTTYRAKQLAR